VKKGEKEYYVYGLIDPRNKQYFYIGKGKGNRIFSHFKKYQKEFNYSKIDKIKEIESSGLKVIKEKIFSSLDEETSFELEKILIYKLGRKKYSEGILTNIKPGGKWKPGDSNFYSESFQPNFDLNKLDILFQQKYLKIPTISQFNYLNTKDNKQYIYKFNGDGILEHKLSLDNFVESTRIDLFNSVRENELPIYSKWIYSKYYFDKLYISDKIPFTELDVVDQQFNKDFDKEYNKSEKFKSKCIIEGVVRMMVERNKNIITITSYYPSGNKKHYKNIRNGIPLGLSCDWYENGNLKRKEIINSNDNYNMTKYFENGKMEMKWRELNGKKTYVRWFENGIIKEEFIENVGYIQYNKQGEKIRIKHITDLLSFKGKQFKLEIDFPKKEKTIEENKRYEINYLEKEKLTEEMKKEIKKDKIQSDIDWLEYLGEIDEKGNQ